MSFNQLEESSAEWALSFDFIIPKRSQGNCNKKGRQGVHTFKTYSLVDETKVYLETVGVFRDNQLIHLDQYYLSDKGAYLKKRLSCDVKEGRPQGTYYADIQGTKLKGHCDNDGVFTGWEYAKDHKGFWLSGKRHGEWVYKPVDAVKKTVQYEHGHQVGFFSIQEQDKYTFGCIENGQTRQSTLTARDFPLLKKLGAWHVAAQIMLYRAKRAHKNILGARSAEKWSYRR